MIKVFKFLPVGYKMFILYFVSMCISVMVMGYLSYNKATDIIESKVGMVALQTLQQAGKRLDTILEEYESRSQSVFGYKVLQQGILGHFNDNYERTQTSTQINNFIANFVNVNNDIVNLYILGERDSSFRYAKETAFTALPPVAQEDRAKEWYQKIIKADGRLVWFGIQESFMGPASPLSPENGPIFCFGRAIKDLNGDREIIGVILFELDPTAIREILSEIDFNASGMSVIVDQNNRVVGDTNITGVVPIPGLMLPNNTSGAENISLHGEQMIMVYNQLSINKWNLVGIAPTQELVKDSREFGFYTLYIAIGFMIVSVILAVIVARIMHNPVHILLRSMRRAKEGDFDVRIISHRNDEFGILFENFNTMVSRIKDLIDELYVQRLLKKEIQLKMLASQINAHFIYNTLDSIHWIARIHKVNDISTMIFGLSKYLRISLSDGRDLVTVKEAIELVESYLSIQKIRYKDKFEVDVHIDPELLDEKVLKFVFQPLVENAIYHGLENKKGQGLLQINWTKEEGVFRFVVRDNGVGISQNHLNGIKIALSNTNVQEDNHFALKNINTQIKLAYGHQYGLDIESEPGVGTIVTMVFPIMD